MQLWGVMWRGGITNVAVPYGCTLWCTCAYRVDGGQAMTKLFVSNHSLENLASCETKHMLSWKRYQPKDAAPALECGRHIHNALQAWRTGTSEEQALSRLASEYRDYSVANVPPDNARDWRNVVNILQEYMRRRPLASAPWDEVLAVEVGYAAPLVTTNDGTEVWYYTRPDMVVRRDGRIYTVDTKSTGWIKPDWANQWDVSPQITGQCWAVSKCFGEPCADAFIDGIELGKMNSSNKKCAKHGVAYHECAAEHLNFKFHMTHREPFQVRSWQEESCVLIGQMRGMHASVAQYGMRSARVNGIYTGACVAYGRKCDYAPWCDTGRQEGLEEQLFEASTFQLAEAGVVYGPGMEPVEVPVR